MMNPDLKLMLRPHYSRKGDELYFMISRRPTLKMSADDIALWEALPQTPAIAKLPANAANSVNRFLKEGICDAVSASWPKGRKQVLIIEPHCDDAALSVGGLLWKWRNTHEVTVATVGGRSNFTSYFFTDKPFFDPARISAIRDGEGQQYAALTGGKYIGLRNNEATLRFNDATWDKDWFSRNKFAVLANNNHKAAREEQDSWKSAIASIVAKTPCVEVWMPLGAGQHADHEITRNACFELLAEGAFAGKTVRLYSDVPYDSKFPAHKQAILDELVSKGAALSCECHPIADVLEDKFRLLSVFGSQFKLEAVRHGVTESARLAGGECLWTVTKPPESWDWQAVDSYVHGNDADFASWLTAFRNTKRARFLLLNPAGRFKQEATWLQTLVPGAAIEVYASPSARDEAEQANLANTAIVGVGEGSVSWAKLAGKLALASRTPVLFVAGGRVAQARQLSLLWPGTKTLVASSLDEITRGLRRAAT